MSDPSTTTDETTDAVADTTAKVHEYLAPFDDVDQDADGNASLQYGSARVRITVETFDQDQAVVKVCANVVNGARPTPELFHHLATNQSEIGHLSAVEEPDGTATINFSHSLLGEFLNPAELRMTVIAVAFAADQLDDALAAQFGGTVHDADANLG
jgi:hypothetical protein